MSLALAEPRAHWFFPLSDIARIISADLNFKICSPTTWQMARKPVIYSWWDDEMEVGQISWLTLINIYTDVRSDRVVVVEEMLELELIFVVFFFGKVKLIWAEVALKGLVEIDVTLWSKLILIFKFLRGLKWGLPWYNWQRSCVSRGRPSVRFPRVTGKLFSVIPWITDRIKYTMYNNTWYYDSQNRPQKGVSKRTITSLRREGVCKSWHRGGKGSKIAIFRVTSIKDGP
jgi:hypothetical protein